MKKSVSSFKLPLIILLTLGCLAPAWAQYSTTVNSFNPLGYWRLNETAASPAINKVANLGSVGSIADGNIVLNVGKGEPGAVGSAIRLVNNGNAVGYCGSKIDVPYNAALNPTAPISIEFWAKPNGLGSDGTGFCPISSLNPHGFNFANRSGWLFYLNNTGTWQFRLGTVGGYAGICTGTSGNASVGTWQHIAATYDGVNVRLYANGVQIGTTTANINNWTRNSQFALRIGGTALTGTLSDGPANSATGTSGNRGFEGWVDEVALYNTLLSPSTVAAHYSAATTNTLGYGAQILADNPIAYYNMDESAVTPPAESSLPIASNTGSEGAAADGTNRWGSAAAQAGATFGGFGAGNNATFFNGSSGQLALQDAAGLHFSGNITLMAWVKPQVRDFFRDILAHGWDGDYAETFLRISRGGNLDLNSPEAYGDNSLNFYEVGVTAGSGYYDSAMFAIPDGDMGKWVFLAGTYDGASWNLYRNGQLVSSTPSANGALDVAGPWSIGSRSAPSDAEGLYFGGHIDEPAIFNTALSAANILNIYNSAQAFPVITRAVQSPASPGAPVGTVFSGLSASFNVWAEGAPALSYLWTSNGISTGVTATNITLNNFVAGSKTIAVIVTNPYGSATSSVTFSVIDSAPLILTQPVPITRFTGFPFTFSVVAGGSTPLSYQWKTNGVDITGATSPSYSAVASAAIAFNYSVTINNANGSINSASVPLTVLAIPSGYAGAVLSGSPPISFWRLGETSGTIAYDYVGGRDATYHSTTLNQPGYSVIDANTAVTFGGENSYAGGVSGVPGVGINFSGHVNFTLEAWVNGPAGLSDESSIIAKGAGQTGTTATEQFSLDVISGNYRFFTRGGGNVIFSAEAATGPNGTWQHVVGVYDDTAGAMAIYVNGELSGSGGTRPSGLRASSAEVAIGSKHLGNDPDFDGTFNGTVDEVAVYNYAMSPATVQAHYGAAYGPSLPPAIAKQPDSITNYVSLPAKLTVAAYGSVPLTYQWKKANVNIPGATSSSLTITNLALSDDANYTVGITNVNGGILSATAKITVLSAPTSAPAIPGLVVHLPFNNNLTDATGRGNNATAMHQTDTATNASAATFVSDGFLGQGFHYQSEMGAFPGPTTTNTDYATLGVRPDLQFSSNVNFSVALWIRIPLNFTGGDLPYFTTTAGSTFGAGIVFAPSYGGTATVSDTGTDPGGWAYSIYDTAGNGVGFYGDIGSINDGNWHHLVHVIERGVGSTTYLDGVAVPTDAFLYHRQSKQAGTSAAAAINVDTGLPASIGQDPTGHYGETGAGDIDDLGVWRKALTPLEAASIYMAAVSNQLSFAGAPITLTIEKVGSSIKLTWPAGTLQQADNVTGLWSDVSPVSPRTIPANLAKKFYRVRL